MVGVSRRSPCGSDPRDLRFPEIWRDTQNATRSLRVRDKITIVDAALSFMVEARVVGASETGVTLSISKRHDMDPRSQALPQTETHRIIFAMRGYSIQTKATGLMYQGGLVYSSLGEAINVLHGLMPKRAA